MLKRYSRVINVRISSKNRVKYEPRHASDTNMLVKDNEKGGATVRGWLLTVGCC